MPLHDQHPIPPIISLRRNGDIISLLPLLKWMADKNGQSVRLVVHRDYQGILEGVSYIVPLIWNGDMEDPMTAARIHRGVNAQVTGRRLAHDRNCRDYAANAWKKLGYVWNRHRKLVFDRRDPTREQLLADLAFKTGLPKILVKLDSLSSPFTDADRVRQMLQDEFSGMAEVVNLDAIKAHRIYDLLGLLDRAACLVSADTCTLWLAKASKCPVVALVNPHPFLASPPVGNVMQRIPYTEVVPKWDDIASTIHSTLHDIGTDGMVLTFSEFTPTDPDTQRRNDAARLTWPSLGARLMPYFGNRTSKQIGDPRSMPYVRDMLDAAFSNGTDRIAVITNNDILFDNRLHESIERGCNDCGCWWAYRLASPQNPATDHGADLFAMTRQWWFEHRHLYPDFLIGFAWWDDIMVRMMRWSGCLGLEPLYYHEPHPPAMTTRGHTAGMKHNEQLALPWLNEHHELHQKPES